MSTFSANLIGPEAPLLEWSYDGGLASGEYVTPGVWQNWNLAYVRHGDGRKVSIDKKPRYHVCTNFVDREVIGEVGHYTEYERCTFTDCTIYPRPNTKFKDCLFVRSSCRNVGPFVWFDYCEWKHVSDISCQINDSGAAVTNCLFDRTSHGPYIQATYGTITDVLLSGNVTRELTFRHNDGDGVGIEGIGYVDRIMILHCRHQGSGAAVNLWDVSAGRVKVYDLIGNYINSYSPNGKTVQELDLAYVTAAINANNVVNLKEYNVYGGK